MKTFNLFLLISSIYISVRKSKTWCGYKTYIWASEHNATVETTAHSVTSDTDLRCFIQQVYTSVDQQVQLSKCAKHSTSSAAEMVVARDFFATQPAH